MRILFVIVFLLLLSSRGISQETEFRAELFPFFDNAEFGHSSVQIPQTMSGVRFAPGFGFKFDSLHSLNVGVNMLHEFGSDEAVNDLFPVAYYEFHGNPFRFVMGAFPRSLALDKYPKIFFRDSIEYYRPNLNGIFLGYDRKNIEAGLWLDWTSRQSLTDRESFFVGFSGKYKMGIFYLQEFSYMFHFAGMKDPVVDEALHDNVMMLTSAGIDLSGKTLFDLLEINGGWVVGLDRARADNTGWIRRQGFLSETRVQYKKLGLFNTFYSGNGQMYFYEKHNNELYWGDPFYRTRTYNRSDIYIDFIKHKSVSTRLIYSLHFTENTMYHEQALRVSVNINHQPGSVKSNR